MMPCHHVPRENTSDYIVLYIVHHRLSVGIHKRYILTMARLLSVALLSLGAVLTSAASSPRSPWCIQVPRGGSSEGSAEAAVHSIPLGGASYSSQLEGVKSQILEAAAESVRRRYMYMYILIGYDREGVL
jgi:hypothetical protein